MGGEGQTEINAAILTAGHIINTTLDTEDLTEALKMFSRFKKECKERATLSTDSSPVGDTDLIATILTAGHIVNTRTLIESMEEICGILDEFRNLVVQIKKKVPRSFEERSELNIAAAIIVAGLIVNTIKWEESILESGVLLKACKEGLIKLH